MKPCKTLNSAQSSYAIALDCPQVASSLTSRLLVKLFFPFIVLLLLSFQANALTFEITGTVFLDENENGIREASETEGIEGVTISIFDATETLMNVTVTDENGAYVFGNISEIETCRLEFTLTDPLQETYAVSQFGESNGTFIQFVEVGSVANLGLKRSGNNCIEDIPTNITSVVPWGPTTKQTLLDHGVGAVTCSAYPLDDEEHRYVMGLIDFTEVETSPDPIGGASVEPSYPGMFHHPDWVAKEMGNVFGMEIDEEFNMYVTACSQIWQRVASSGGNNLSQEEVENAWRYGDIGGGKDDLAAAGTIYKVDAYTGEASVFAQLPQQEASLQYFGDAGIMERISGPGLGNLTFDHKNKMFYVTNFEDGKIYRLNEEGDILDTYDPFTLDDGAPGFAPLGERIWGIDIYQNKLYFSVWYSTTLYEPYAGNSEVHSIELNEDGSFVGNEKLEFTYTIQYYPVLYSPIADIEINEAGRMLVAQRTMLNDATVYNHQSATGIYDLNETTNTWENTSNLRVGQSGPSECYGGAAWDPSRDMIWISAADINAGYGPHGIVGVHIDQFNTDFQQADEWAVVPFTPPTFVEDVKGFGGDVALGDLNLFEKCDAVTIEIGNYIWEDLNGDGIQGAGELPLQGVMVQLFDENELLIAQTRTDHKGNYFFNSNNVDVYGVSVTATGIVSPSSGSYNGLFANTNYTIVLGTDQQVSKDQLLLNDVLYQLTVVNSGDNKLIDSDGLCSANVFDGRPYYRLTTGDEGNNRHNIDFGWKIVEPLEFNATAIDNEYALLEWTTLQEVNSDYFDVQRSKNGVVWENIERVSAAGFSTSAKDYKTTDNQPYMGVSFYRLEWFDYDGSSVYSVAREVLFTEDREEPVVDSDDINFPNPVTGTLPIHFDITDFEGAIIDIYRADGALMWRGQTVDEYTNLDVSQFASGNYVLLMILNNNTKRYTEKLVVWN